MEFKHLLSRMSTSTRMLQIVLCLVCLGCSAYQVAAWYAFSAVNFALFASITGLGLSSLLLVGPWFNPLLAERLPGFIDCVLSSLYSLFFLAVGGSMASYGGCGGAYYGRYYYPYYGYYWGHRRLLAVSTTEVFAAEGFHRRLQQSYSAGCGTWSAAIAMGFLLFILYGVSAVLAGLDIRAGKGMVKPQFWRKGGVAPATVATKDVSDKPTAPADATALPA